MTATRYRVNVLLKDGVLDVQGKAIESSLPELGVASISDVRVGKLIEFTMDKEAAGNAGSDSTGSNSNPANDSAVLRKVCEELFSNPVIESYSIEEVK